MNHESVPQWGKAALKLLGVANEESNSDSEGGNTELPFGLRTHMLSEQKALLYRALVAAMAADAVVFAKVRLSDFLFVSGGGDDLKHAIKMDRKYVDFLLCDPFSMQPLAVVESVFPLQRGEKRRPRDPFVTRALKTAGITLLKIETRPGYPIEELRELLLPKIGPKQQATELSWRVDEVANDSDSQAESTPEAKSASA